MDRLVNTVRPYAWGSTTAIPALLGRQPTGEPQAELWMGAHPGAPSRIDRGQGERSLAEVVAADPEGELGAAVVQRFGPGLPFLFKVLAAGHALSVQVHPTLEQAREGFAAEEAAGVPLDAPHRNYKDANHKPEMICALSDFDGLCGFRAPAETADLFDHLGVAALAPWAAVLRGAPEEEALRTVLAEVLGADRDGLATVAGEVAEALEKVAAGDGPHAASCAAYAGAARDFPGDPGIIAALLLNHVVLRPGEALYLGAGVPHAYLSGLGVELMANSDNVLRCGLTPKHVDVPELMRVVDFSATRPTVLTPQSVPGAQGEELYPAPVAEFRLSRYLLDGTARVVDGRTPQILLVTEGTATLADSRGRSLDLVRGESAYLPADGAEVTLGGSGAVVFRATVSL
ncbi:mannose-6-phosphate isomerase, class I [Peterkaempfera griseoplana]|uniref:mannose-6-phosphate isomerase, class I n=1 Tax=Peterkaempfera griseoplana TaxID=66896 RepID=UPI0006E2BA7A|nr:mannose-6-phosphate isomerase, class I [Peterkaempfera griseoplana]